MILFAQLDFYIGAARFFLCVALLLVAYLLACGVNTLLEKLFSGLQGRRQRPSRHTELCCPGNTAAMPAPGPGPYRLPPAHQPIRSRARRAFQPPPLHQP